MKPFTLTIPLLSLALLSPALAQEPGLDWSTFLGGTGNEVVQDAARTSTGDWIVIGQSTSPDFPISANAYQPSQAGGGDSFVAKIAADGSSLLWATYIGGTENDEAWQVEVDSQDRPIVAGYTESAAFSLTVPGVGDHVRDGLEAGFVCRLQANGQGLDWWTFVDGAYYDEILSLTLAPNDEPLVCGTTGSFDFPTVGSNAVPFPGNGWWDESAFVTRLSADGTAIQLSTCLGGTGGYTSAWDVNLNLGGTKAYLCGETEVHGLATPGAFDEVYSPGFFDRPDGFLARVDLSTGAFSHCTYLGGNDREALWSVEVHPSGDVVVVGDSDSADFPTTVGAYQTTYGGHGDVIVTRLTPDLATQIFGTYIGGNGDEDEFVTMTLVSSGIAVLFSTNLQGFPVVDGAWDHVQNDLNGDLVLARLDDLGTTLEYASYLGGHSFELGACIVHDQDDVVLIAGLTSSPTFPARGAGFDHILDGQVDGFIARFYLAPGPTLNVGTVQRGAATTLQVQGTAPGELSFFVFSLSGKGFGIAPSAFGGARLDILDPSLLGSAPGTAMGTADLVVQIPPNAPLIGIDIQALVQRGAGGDLSLVTGPVHRVIQP